jgi:hypothetical protein
MLNPKLLQELSQLRREIFVYDENSKESQTFLESRVGKMTFFTGMFYLVVSIGISSF